MNPENKCLQLERFRNYFQKAQLTIYILMLLQCLSLWHFSVCHVSCQMKFKHNFKPNKLFMRVNLALLIQTFTIKKKFSGKL